MSEKPQLLPTLAAVLSCILGGSAIVATRFAVAEADPLAVAVLRYSGAALVMIAIVAAVRRRRVSPASNGIWPVLGLGVLQFAIFGWLFTVSLQYMPAARAALVLATMPILTLALSALMGRERMTGAKLMGAVFACGGVALALGDRALATGPEVWKGDALMFGAALIGSVYNVLTGFVTRTFPAVSMAAVQLPAGAIVLFAALVVTGDVSQLVNHSPGGWIAVVYLATIGGAASFYAWIWALERIPPSRVAVTVTLNPISAAILGANVLGEPVTTRLLLGLAGVVIGIVLSNWPMRVREPAKATG